MKKTRFFVAAVALMLVASMLLGVCAFAADIQDTAKLNVDTSGGKVKVLVDGAIKSTGSSKVSIKVPVGATVTLVAENTAGEFMFWTNSAMNTCSEESSYSFTMRTDESITAWFTPLLGSLVMYRNDNTSKQILASAEFTSSDAVTEHLVASTVKHGYKFVGWSLTTDQINQKIAAGEAVITVSPVWEAKVTSYSVNVVGGTIKETGLTTGSFGYGDSITLTANTAPEGTQFVAWRDAAGNVISDSDTLTVSVYASEIYTAEFAASAVTYDPTIALAVSSTGKSVMTATTKFYVPADFTVSEYGLIYSKNLACDEKNMVLDKVDGVIVKKASYIKAGGILVNHFEGLDMVTVRSYLIYKDANDAEHTIYSDVCVGEPDESILRLNIAEHGAVINASAMGPAITAHEYDGYGTKTVKRDVKLNKNVISFVGSQYKSSVYNIPASTLGDDLKDGFSYELMFKVTDNSFTTNYVGILDYEEGGGFGLDVYKTGDADTVKLSFDLSTTSKWDCYTHVINLNEWCHVVYSYDGTNINIYVDGEVIKSVPATAEMKLPTFSSRAGEEYICIGACAQAWESSVRSTGNQGFTGELAICNIFSNPVDNDEAKALYNDVFVFTDEEEAKIAELLDLKHELRVDENGDFKIVVFSDMQCSTDNPENAAVKETMNNIKTVIDREQPDLVLLAGDNAYNMATAEKLKNYLTNMMGYIEEKQIPWAHIFGNHDDECNTAGGYYSISKEEQQKVYESFEYCISKDVEELFGVSNHVLPVLSHDGSKIAFNVWGLDSGAYTDNPINNLYQGSNYFLGKYQYIQKNQVDWYTETSKLLEKYNGERIPAMMYFHIPLQEYYTAWNQKEIEGGFEWDGEKNDNISAATINCGLFAAMLERGDVKVVTTGHDHINDFMVNYNGIKLSYTACIGTEVYHNDHQLGGRVVNFSTSDPWNVETHMSYVIERDSGDNILELNIAENGTVTNAATSRPALESYTGTSGSKTVMTDSSINRRFIRFTGGFDNNAPSTYWMPTSTVKESLFSDGFAVEAMFRATAESSNYTGIIDFAEGGGFALNFQTISGVNTLIFELGHSTSGYAKITAPIDLNEWYHCVVAYDNINLKLTMYLNGIKVADTNVTTGYRAPGSFWGTPGANICIGACATSNCYGSRGFTGDIAIATVHVSSKAAWEAASLYNAAKASSYTSDGSILKLEIGEDNSVTNTSATGPVLMPFDSASYPKTIVTDAALNRKVINFTGGNGNPSTYRIQTAGVFDDFENGFSYEVLFRPTSTSFVGGSSYVGILDFEEAGGFGLEAYKVSATEMKLSFDFAYLNSGSNAWQSATTTIPVGEWCHVVYSYDGTNINVYVNGTSIYSQAALGALNAPSFTSQAGTSMDGQECLVIGASTWKDSTGIYGFIGDIAICNIFSDSMTASQATDAYNTAMTPSEGEVEGDGMILDLKIDAAAQTVTNGATNGVALNEITHANSSKTIATDATIGKDTVSFTPRGLWATTDSYALPTATIDAKLANGFAFEVYFKVNNIDKIGTSYQGILDYEEAGGFGLNLEPGSATGKASLSLEFAYGPNSAGRQWVEFTKDIDLGAWVHCVFIYDGADKDTISFYVDGVLAGSQTLADDMVMATYKNICIGACTDGTDGGRNGMDGSIAICKIYGDPITADEAIALYNAVK